MKLKKKTNTDHGHDKYITPLKVNKLTAKKFAARLVQANLGSKMILLLLIKKADFDNKLKNVNKNISSNKNELNELSNKVKAMST